MSRDIMKKEMSRRQFLLTLGGVSTLSAIAVTPALAAIESKLNQNKRIWNVQYAVTDKRLAESLDFGYVYIKNGSKRLEVTDGITKLWQKSLRPIWEESGSIVVGLTSYEVFQCLAEQARSQSRRAFILEQYEIAYGEYFPNVSWIIE